MSQRGLFSLACLIGAVWGCTPPPQSPAVQTVKTLPEKRVPHLPLHSYIPVAGLQWLVQLRPPTLLKSPGFLQQWAPLFSTKRLKAWRSSLGFRPEDVDEFWIAQYRLGTLYIFDGELVSEKARNRFQARSLSTSELNTGFANTTHLTGMSGQDPQAFFSIDGHLVAIADGDPSLARIVRAFAETKLKKSVPAFESSFLAPFNSFEPEAQIRAFSIAPLAQATDPVVELFLSGALAVTHRQDELELSASALGAWPQGPEAMFRLNRWVSELLATRELRAMGWGFPTSPPLVHCANAEESKEGRGSLTACTAKGVWDSSAIAVSTHRLVSAPMHELLNEKAPKGWTSETHPLPTATPPP